MKKSYDKSVVTKSLGAITELDREVAVMALALLPQQGEEEAGVLLASRQHDALKFLEEHTRCLTRIVGLVRLWGDDSPNQLVDVAAALARAGEDFFEKIAVDTEGRPVDRGLNPVCADCGSSVGPPRKDGKLKCGECDWESK